MTCCGVPGVKLKLAGAAETPAGRPDIDALICPEKPLSAVAETETDAEAPGGTDVLVGLTDMLKSGWDGGGGPELPPPPPQAVSSRIAMNRREGSSRTLREVGRLRSLMDECCIRE